MGQRVITATGSRNRIVRYPGAVLALTPETPVAPPNVVVYDSTAGVFSVTLPNPYEVTLPGYIDLTGVDLASAIGFRLYVEFHSNFYSHDFSQVAFGSGEWFYSNLILTLAWPPASLVTAGPLSVRARGHYIWPGHAAPTTGMVVTRYWVEITFP